MPSQIENWRSKESLILLRSWAQDGLTDEQLADKMGISRSTLHNWKKKAPEIGKALATGKEVIDAAVENALLKQALDGNLGAICFWLKNRRPDKWRDRPDDELAQQERKARIAHVKASTARMAGGDEGEDADDGVIINYGQRDLYRGSGDPEIDAGIP